MDPAQLHILQHALGVDQYGQGHQYRNHFVTGPGSIDWPNCRALTEAGLMHDHGAKALYGDGSHCFTVTPAGIDAVAFQSPAPPPPPKLTRSQRRYRAFLEVADCYENFTQYLSACTQGRRRARAGEDTTRFPVSY